MRMRNTEHMSNSVKRDTRERMKDAATKGKLMMI